MRQECMPCQRFPHTGGSIPLRISRYINAINNRATTICKDMRICAGQMWSALFKYILTTAVMCASQKLKAPTEEDYEEKRGERGGKKTGCLLSGIDGRGDGEVRNDAVAVDKKRPRLCSMSTFVKGRKGRKKTTPAIKTRDIHVVPGGLCAHLDASIWTHDRWFRRD